MEIRALQVYQMTTENRVLEFLKIGDGYYIDSRMVAKGLGIEHHNFMENLYEYQQRLERWDQLRFQTEVVYRPQGGGNPIKYAMLNRNQALFAITLSRNTEEVVEWKMALIEALDLLEKQVTQQSPKALPAPRPSKPLLRPMSSLRQRILSVLATHAEPVTPYQVWQELVKQYPDIRQNSLRIVMARMRRAGQVEVPSWGQYLLPTK